MVDIRNQERELRAVPGDNLGFDCSDADELLSYPSCIVRYLMLARDQQVPCPQVLTHTP